MLLLATLLLSVFVFSVLWEYKECQWQALVAQLERHSDEFAQVVTTELYNAVSNLVARSLDPDLHVGQRR